MRRRLLGRGGLLALLAVLGACASAGPPRLSTPTSGDRFFVAGYHPYWADGAWRSYPWDVLDEVYYFELEVGPDGSLADLHSWPEEAGVLLERARSAGATLVPTVSIHGEQAFTDLFRSPASVARLVDEVVDLLRSTPGVGGVHLDFEVFDSVDIDVRDGYTAFVAGLRRRLSETDPSLTLSIFTLAFDDDDAYNERALAELADFLVVQGYDLHHQNDAHAGPLASLSGWDRLNWEEIVARFARLGVPARKIVMAVPLFGYEWPVASAEPGAETRGEAVILPLAPPTDLVPELPRALQQAERYGALRDPYGTPYYVFQGPDGWHQGWFEDAASLRAKYAFVRNHGLGGVALFPLAYGNAAMWNDLREAFSRPRD